jgi:hypothetical protein
MITRCDPHLDFFNFDLKLSSNTTYQGQKQRKERLKYKSVFLNLVQDGCWGRWLEQRECVEARGG